ncbi:MAG: hypothetical protein WCI77_04345 [Candidatus Omnitrophota bacterium]
MIKKIIILGNHIQALGVAQIAGRLGVEINLFTDHGLSLARFSKYCTKTVIFKNDQDLIEQITKLYNDKKDTILMPTNDMMVGFLMENYDTLHNCFFISIPPKEVTETCFNKILTYKKAEELGVHFPDSRYPHTLEEALIFSEEIGYPVIIKPAIMFKLFNKVGKKVLPCRTREELVRNYKLAENIIGAKDIIIQRIIGGGAKNLYSFGSFFVDGKTIGGVVVNRLRQRPMDFGNSTTFAISVLNKEIENNAIRFLKGINYCGLSEIEFMWDEEDGTYKLLEINPRTWKWHSITHALEINLIKMLIDYFEGKDSVPKINQLSNVGWVDPFTDFFIFINCLARHRIGIKEYINSLRIKKEIAIFSKDDMLPTLMYALLLPYIIWRRQ